MKPPLPTKLLAGAFLAALTIGFSGLQSAVRAAPAFEELGDKLLTDDLDGLLEELPGVAPPKDPEPAPPKPDAGEDLGAEQSSPLEQIEGGMAEARRLIAVRDASGRTKQVQQKVVTDLDELIEKAKQQCKQCQNASSNSSASQSRQQSQRSQAKPSAQAGQQQKPGDAQQNAGQQRAQQSSQRTASLRGTAGGEAASSRSTDDMMKEVWGRLPQRLREQMLESSSDEFLPEYREAIENYFRRLAEEPAP